MINITTLVNVPHFKKGLEWVESHGQLQGKNAEVITLNENVNACIFISINCIPLGLSEEFFVGIFHSRIQNKLTRWLGDAV